MSSSVKILIVVGILLVIGTVVAVVLYRRKKNKNTSNDTNNSNVESSMLSLSDERYKNNISLTGYGAAYNAIKTIKPIEYMFTRSDGTRPCPTCKSKTRIGFSAQQLEKVDPRLVVIGKDGKKYIDNAQIIALNTSAIKQMMADHEYLKGLVTSDAVQGGGPTKTSYPSVM